MSLFADIKESTIEIHGMHCEKCLARITNALEAIDGVVSVRMSLEEERAWVSGTANEQELLDSIKALGFEASIK